MEWFATTPERPAVFALAQASRGLIAIGQGAIGVIAIGQVATGVVAIGQGAFGWIGWGQAGVGIFHGAGMIGVGGRGFGIVLPLVPRLGKPRELPLTVPFAAVLGGEAGWVEVHLDGAGDVPALHERGPGGVGARLPVKLTAKLVAGARKLVSRERTRVVAYLRKRGDVVVCERLTYEPPRPWQARSAMFRAHLGLGFVALTGIAVAWWALVGRELAEIMNTLLG